jgi:hypothetical protein
MICTRCDGTGFLNLDQVDYDTLFLFAKTGDRSIILDWIDKHSDVQICDCCGNGTDWYGQPGHHDLGCPPASCY